MNERESLGAQVEGLWFDYQQAKRRNAKLVLDIATREKDLKNACARIAQARAAKEMLAPWLRAQAPEPDADTLDQLARLAYETRHGQSVNVADWECMVSPINRERWRNAVAAVLNALGFVVEAEV